MLNKVNYSIAKIKHEIGKTKYYIESYFVTFAEGSFSRRLESTYSTARDKQKTGPITHQQYQESVRFNGDL